jgi:hypothetical protein
MDKIVEAVREVVFAKMVTRCSDAEIAKAACLAFIEAIKEPEPKGIMPYERSWNSRLRALSKSIESGKG